MTTTIYGIYDHPDATYADEDGLFVLSDGTRGNPGCECGEADAIAFLDGEYLCEDGMVRWPKESPTA